VAGARIGEVVYAAQTVPVLFPDDRLPPFMDLGLVMLDKGVATEPAICHFGGPTGLRRSVPAGVERFSFHGNSTALGYDRDRGEARLAARTAVASAAAHPNALVGAFLQSGGDSGAPIVDGQGRAVALLSGPYQPRLEPMLARAEQVLATKLRLSTAPSAPAASPVGVDPGCAPVPASR
jgi:hypothetical protein